jgi:ABC-type sugar transport system ATPase subunit
MAAELHSELTAHAAPAAPMCAVVGLGKRFGSSWACRQVDLLLQAGEVHALVGENGAGKSTLLKMLHGLHRPDEGQLEIDGVRVAFASPREAEAAGIALVPQELDLFPDLTVAENLFVGCNRPRTRWGGIDWRALRRQAEALFATLGIELAVGAPAHTLSGADAQMVAIARALLREARIVLMDEPTAALTQRETQRLFALIRGLTARGACVVYVSHRLEEVFEIADRVTVLRDGLRMHTGPMREMTLGKLVQLMIGRPLEKLFQRTRHRAGEIVLQASGLERRGVFQAISLDLRRGEVVGLCGLIGAGRSALAQTIVGLYSATAGELRVRGEAMHIDHIGTAIKHGIVYVPEERRSQGLFLDFPADWNLSFGALRQLSQWGCVQRSREQAISASWRGKLAVRGDAAAPVSALSGGNQQKVLLARSLALEPEVILLDEPTRGVDVGAKAEIYRIIDELASAGKAILMISSDMVELLALSDRVLVMHQGRLTGEFLGPEFPLDQIGEAVMGVAS